MDGRSEIERGLVRVAERAFTEPVELRPAGSWSPFPAPKKWPDRVLVFDTETTTDASQSLLFGSALMGNRVKDHYEPDMELLFYADDLPSERPEEFAVLKAYARKHRVELRARSRFMQEAFFKVAYELRGLVVAFNLPFDLSRLAVGLGDSRGPQRGGFSFWLDGDERGENRYRPRVRIKNLDSKRAFMTFSGRFRPNRWDLIPEGKEGCAPDESYVYPGHLLDLRTLAFALSSQGHSLASACEAFGVQDGKTHAEEHGHITEAYIDYNRQDVRATFALLNAVKREFDRHPIRLNPAKAYSPASLAKSYLDRMNIVPPLVGNREFPRVQLGQAMNAYYGGRAECRIRKSLVPVMYLDFLSMYPTVNALMGLWDLITAERLEVVDATEEARQLLEDVTLDHGFDKRLWPRLRFFAEIQPDHDVLPVRAQYAEHENGYQIGINPFTSVLSSWYAGPDLVASKLLTGKAPKVLRAWVLAPIGRQGGLRRTSLRGRVEIDPSRDDFFRKVIEERHRIKRDDSLPAAEREPLSQALKILANSGGYGIFAEMNRDSRDSAGKKRSKDAVAKDGDSELPTITVYARDAQWVVKAVPETPGRYAFPPLAALSTSAARLMLTMLERQVTDQGGSYAFCDTDSMAIVANKHGGLVACHGGERQQADGRSAVRALRWGQVHEIVQRFNALNPYDPTAVTGSVLKIEDINKLDGRPEQLYAYAISAKRYVLCNLDADRVPVLRDPKEHGLGHLLNPTDPDSDDRAWIPELWRLILHQELGLSITEPAWLSRPALTRINVSTPGVAKAFNDLNGDQGYYEQIKPFNFILAAHVAPFGHPPGTDPQHYQLIAPFESDPGQWKKLPWRNKYDARTAYTITTTDEPAPHTARVTSYRDVLEEFQNHPETKSQGGDQTNDPRQAVGLLQRRQLYEIDRVFIGKEANRIEEAQAGMLRRSEEAWNDYGHHESDDWSLHVKHLLRDVGASRLAATTGVSRRYVQLLVNGSRQPGRTLALRLVAAALTKLGRPAGTQNEPEDLMRMAAEIRYG